MNYANIDIDLDISHGINTRMSTTISGRNASPQSLTTGLPLPSSTNLSFEYQSST